MKLLPDLHRAGQVPDWEKVDPGEWNDYQRRAAETNGWDTPGNRITLVGAAATLTGLVLINRDTKPSVVAGTALLAFGRIQDLRDGKVAAATGTRSPKGEAVDAGVDSFLMLVAAMMLKRSGVLEKSDADEMIANTGVKMGASVIGKMLGHEMHTGRMGKYGTFARWGGVGLSFLERVADRFDFDHLELGDFELDGIDEKLGQAADFVMQTGLRMDRQATAGYVRDALFGQAPDAPGLQ